MQVRARCQKSYATGYDDYGGRGISVCSVWDQDFLAFEAWALSNGYKDNLTLERTNVNGNYEPLNCIWADQAVQSSNSRKNKVSKFTFKGVDQLPSGSWRSVIQVRGVIHRLGVFSSESLAVDARNQFIRDNNLPHLQQ